MLSVRVARSAVIGCLAIATGCGGDGSGTTEVITVSKVVVTATGASTLNVGQTVTLTAAAFDVNNKAITAPLPSTVWSSSATTVATVDQFGKVIAVASGDATISASIAGVKGTINVRVILASASKDTVFTVGIATFSPTFLTIAKGATMIFALGGDGIGHDVQFNAKTGSPAYIPVQSRANVPVTFSTSGDFTYYCPTHPQMTGTITVQ